MNKLERAASEDHEKLWRTEDNPFRFRVRKLPVWKFHFPRIYNYLQNGSIFFRSAFLGKKWGHQECQSGRVTLFRTRAHNAYKCPWLNIKTGPAQNIIFLLDPPSPLFFCLGSQFWVLSCVFELSITKKNATRRKKGTQLHSSQNTTRESERVEYTSKFSFRKGKKVLHRCRMQFRDRYKIDLHILPRTKYEETTSSDLISIIWIDTDIPPLLARYFYHHSYHHKNNNRNYLSNLPPRLRIIIFIMDRATEPNVVLI